MFGLLLSWLRQNVPEMSATERAALDAGDTWADAELFSGRPNLERLLAEGYPGLSAAEQAFLDGPVEEVCRLVDPQEVERTREFSPAVWECLRRHHFFGLALPKRYGGHEFSALGCSAVFGKLTSRSMSLSSIVLIPNSVGPGELLLEVGTEAQRDYYLPRLARGEEIPCFALTEPHAGSDAAPLSPRGAAFRDVDGELKIRLDWDKRYITLAPIATLIGLAFKLEDPHNLLGHGPEPGITCALVPANLPGVEIGMRHDPMGIPFPNGPTRGRGVVVPASAIIGGPDFAGRGWQMLMEALSGGRAVSLPAQATAGAKYLARVAGAYAGVRQQFGVAIGRFEGIEEPLARIASTAYLLEAARVYTCGALAAGHRPAVVSALMKYNSTELARRASLDAMDILGGAAICRGPRNLVAEGFVASPIGITVEGANILTRTLIVFGQGAIRCHPYALRVLEAVRTGNLPEFRRAFSGQLLHFGANFLRAGWHGLTGGLFAGSPVSGPPARYWRRLSWAAATYAFYADLAMALLGGKLKFRGKITGRLADLLSWLYLGVAVLRRFEAEGRRAEDLPLLRYTAETCLARIQEGFEGLLANIEAPLVGALLRGPVSLWHRLVRFGKPPADRLGGQVAQLLLRPGAQRDRLTAGLYIEPGSALHQLERAFELALLAEAPLAKIRRAIRAGELAKGPLSSALFLEAQQRGVISEEENNLLAESRRAAAAATAVDAFTLAELRGAAQAVAEKTELAAAG